LQAAKKAIFAGDPVFLTIALNCMFRNKAKNIIILLISFTTFVSCMNAAKERVTDRRLKIVTTTTFLNDLVHRIGGDSVNLTGLMGAGVDPHLYKPTEGDVFRIISADIIFYNGLHLEGRLADLFKKMKRQNINTFSVGEVLPADHLLAEDEQNNIYDPHIWLSLRNWRFIAKIVAKKMAELDKENHDHFIENLAGFIAELDELERFIEEKISEVPPAQRVLITAHDAFGYFGYEFGFEVIGLQGISTVGEAGAADVRNLASLIYRRRIPAIFVETSVSERNIKAVREAVASRGFEVKIGGTLFSDALGSPGTPEGTYIGMYKHNVITITKALKGQ
jgi:manganese/zinc/iron transport system substrate-binding protein